MSALRLVGVVALFGVLAVPEARAAPPGSAQIEINFLLGYIEESGCEFFRNGTWHDPKVAQAHLREKYEYMVGKGKIESAEDFIEKVATKSSISGEPYEVRCHGETMVTSNQWLREELVRFRTFNKRPASSRMTPRPGRTSLRSTLETCQLAEAKL